MPLTIRRSGSSLTLKTAPQALIDFSDKISFSVVDNVIHRAELDLLLCRFVYADLGDQRCELSVLEKGTGSCILYHAWHHSPYQITYNHRAPLQYKDLSDAQIQETKTLIENIHKLLYEKAGLPLPPVFLFHFF
jgi:hypothetical protein